jgi:sensor histidine kinase YesM
MVLFAFLRDRDLLLFGLTTITAGLAVVGLSGFLLEFVWPEHPGFDHVLTWFYRPLWVLPLLLFAASFLQTRQHARRWHRVLMVLGAVVWIESAALFLLSERISYSVYARLSGAALAVYLLAALWVSLVRLRQGCRQAPSFLIAFGLLLLFQVGQLGTRFGLWTSSWLGVFGPQFGVTFLAILFSSALGHHIRSLRLATIESEHRALLASREALHRLQEAEHLAGQLAQARLRVLRRQLQPGLLFEALDAVAGLVHLDPRLAERRLALLADLLRMASRERGGEEVRLAEEVALAERLVRVEQARSPCPLAFHADIAPECLDARVPHLVLYHLVESAVRDDDPMGLGPGTVTVEAEEEHGKLILRMTEDCPSAATGAARLGAAVEGVRQRLLQLFGDEAGVRSAPVGVRGFLVELRMPFSLAAENGLNAEELGEPSDA